MFSEISSEGTISRDILAYEKEHNAQLPRRGTVHEIGRSVSHKTKICRKRIVEKSPTSKVASETNHSPEEVEYYVQCFFSSCLFTVNGNGAELGLGVPRDGLVYFQPLSPKPVKRRFNVVNGRNVLQTST